MSRRNQSSFSSWILDGPCRSTWSQEPTCHLSYLKLCRYRRPTERKLISLKYRHLMILLWCCTRRTDCHFQLLVSCRISWSIVHSRVSGLNLSATRWTLRVSIRSHQYDSDYGSKLYVSLSQFRWLLGISFLTYSPRLRLSDTIVQQLQGTPRYMFITRDENFLYRPSISATVAHARVSLIFFALE